MIFVAPFSSKGPLTPPSVKSSKLLMDSYPPAWVQITHLGFQAHSTLLRHFKLQTLNLGAWSTSQATKNQQSVLIKVVIDVNMALAKMENILEMSGSK